MASVQKFAQAAAMAQIGHAERTNSGTESPHIDKSKTGENEQLSPRRDCAAKEYYKQRLSELSLYNNRKDIKTLAGWIVTAPADLPKRQEAEFFRKSYEFIAARYGEKNIVTANLHRDETQPHLHVLFIPATPDGRVCAADVLTRKELRRFHPELQSFLRSAGITARVINGATSAGNKTVEQLRAERPLHQYERDERSLIF